MDGDLGEKTEEPTPKRKSQARGKGQVAKSKDLAGAINLAAAILLLALFGGSVLSGMGLQMRLFLEGRLPGFSLAPDTMARALGDALIRAGALAAPIMLIAFFVAGLSNIIQFGWLFTTKPLKPKIDKLNPINGVKRLFKPKSLVKLVVDSVKMAAIAGVGALIVYFRLPDFAAMPTLGPVQAFLVLGRALAELAAALIVVLIIIGVLDFIYQKWDHHRNLKMTKQEVKDERRSMDGDQQIKGRRLRMYQQIVLQQIGAAVPKADVVVANPTHFSVALRYDAETMKAPKVIAKGADLLAFRIRELARAHSVPVVERPPLARALYHGVETGQEIHAEHYEAVAEVLAYVYRQDAAASQQQPEPENQAA